MKTKLILWFILVAGFAGFVLLKMSHLSAPFFWDEAGVYGRIAFHLADNGLSLHPKSVDQWLSRGHPLLYSFFIASFCKIFGTTTFVAHFGNLVLSVFLLASIFIHTRQIYNFRSGLFAVAFLMIQPIFFAQAVMVLPEIALGLCFWWLIWAYYKRSLWIYVIAGSAAVLIKETALIWLFAITFYELLSNRSRFHIKHLKWLLPVAPFLIFLVIQKLTWDWYLFPYHITSISFNVDHVATIFWRYLVFIFWEQGRGVIPVLIIPFCIYEWKTRPSRLKEFRHYITSFGVIAAFVCLCYMLFSGTSFLLERYMLPVLPFVAIFVGVSMDKFYNLKGLLQTIVLTAILYLLPASKMSSDHFVYDIDMSYLRSIDATKKCLEYMINEGIYTSNKFSVNIPLTYAILDKRFGYLPEGTNVSKSSPVSDLTEFAVELKPGSELINPDSLDLYLVYEEFYHDIKMSVYKVGEAPK